MQNNKCIVKNGCETKQIVHNRLCSVDFSQLILLYKLLNYYSQSWEKILIIPHLAAFFFDILGCTNHSKKWSRQLWLNRIYFLVSCLLFLVPCSLSLVSCTLSLVSCLLYLVFCTLFVVNCPLSLVTYF